MCIRRFAEDFSRLRPKEAWPRSRTGAVLPCCRRRELSGSTLRGLFLWLGMRRTMESHGFLSKQSDAGVPLCKHGHGCLLQWGAWKSETKRLVCRAAEQQEESQFYFTAHQQQGNPASESMVDSACIPARCPPNGAAAHGHRSRVFDGRSCTGGDGILPWAWIAGDHSTRPDVHDLWSTTIFFFAQLEIDVQRFTGNKGIHHGWDCQELGFESKQILHICCNVRWAVKPSKAVFLKNQWYCKKTLGP